jgi:hypothetical protein
MVCLSKISSKFASPNHNLPERNLPLLKQNPGLGLGKRAASGGKRKALSAEEGAGKEEEPEEARGLNTAVVKQFIGKLLHRDRLGPDYFSDVELQQWNEWLDAVPASAAESVDAKSLLPVQMPPKCLPRPEAGSSSDGPATMGQQEILTYSNAGGRRFGTAERRRQYAMRKALCLSACSWRLACLQICTLAATPGISSACRASSTNRLGQLLCHSLL